MVPSLRLPLVWLLLSLSGLLASCPRGLGAEPALDLDDTSRLRLGVGDRISVLNEEAGEWVSLPQEALDKGVPLDLFEMWLPRGWDEDWVTRKRLEQLAAQGVTPVIVHYYFGDAISRERVEAQRDGWYSSMWRMANLIRMDAPVLVVLEPEFNVAPPEGETAITSWPWFARDLRAAAEMIREQAPNALVGTCPGDFPGTPNLEPLLGPVAPHLDFLAFQEMRASTDPEAGRTDYLEVGRAASDYARYLKRAFGRPLLLAYVAVSSHGSWEKRQADALRDLHRHRAALRAAGVFGLIYFQLRDDPAHLGYFGAAERHFGLLRADGTAKPALEVFRALGR
jgi:hypothetical protein